MDSGHTSATIFSLTHDLPSPRLPGAEAADGLDTARLALNGQTLACGIRWIGRAGARLRVEGELAEQVPAQLQVAGAPPLIGRTLWSDGAEAGLLFDAPVDILGLVARNLARASAERRRLPRIELRQTVGIHRGADVEQVRTRDISQGGVGVEARSLAPGEAVQLTFDGLRPLEGCVRWVSGETAGIVFAEELGWQILFPWLREIQQAPPAAPGGPEPDGLLQDKLALRLDLPGRVREGARWWNCRIHALTAQQVEFEARQSFPPGTGVWVALPEIGGGPVRVLTARNGRTLGEFRMPLRDTDLRTLTASRRAG
ncbi:PilZ domain-containing protein [uncultured Sphingomonas sp.]|uniref:PilZ domain-containing protein n=1 Tax=uncultured Sphingomonas sp. TaxID=158754 RepID=UPI0025D504AF|nr:PilZ domain-containing protein [uncultured Sphingomonas sp.]